MAKSGGELDYHIVGVRLRVVGEGNFRMQLIDYSDIQTQTLVPIVNVPATRFEPFRLSNFQSQRTRLHGFTTDIDEWFDIHRIVVFVKPVAIEYPG